MTDTLSAELLPCPFCQKAMVSRDDYGRERMEHRLDADGEGVDCPGFTLWFYTDDPLQVAAWNSRGASNSGVVVTDEMVERVAFDPKQRGDEIAMAVATLDGEKWVRLSDYLSALTAEPQAVEPVAWRYRSYYDDRWEYCLPEQWRTAVDGFRERHPEAQALYAQPRPAAVPDGVKK